MAAPAMHRMAQAFRAARARALPAASGLELRAFGLEGFGLIVQVTALEPWRFNPAFLAHGPAVGRDLLSAEGARLWDQLRELALAAVAAEGGPGDLAALILAPEAAERARAAYAFVEARAA